MISHQRIKELILESLKNIKNIDPIYKDLALQDDTVLLGAKAVMDSVAFTAFITDLEEKIEDETGKEYVLRIEEMVVAVDRGINLSVADMVQLIAKDIG